MVNVPPISVARSLIEVWPSPRWVVGRDAASVVRHFNGERRRLLLDSDGAVLRVGVAGDVVQCLQDDAVGGDLRQPR
jgi:hypothetical protein